MVDGERRGRGGRGGETKSVNKKKVGEERDGRKVWLLQHGFVFGVYRYGTLGKAERTRLVFPPSLVARCSQRSGRELDAKRRSFDDGGDEGRDPGGMVGSEMSVEW